MADILSQKEIEILTTDLSDAFLANEEIFEKIEELRALKVKGTLSNHYIELQLIEVTKIITLLENNAKIINDQEEICLKFK